MNKLLEHFNVQAFSDIATEFRKMNEAQQAEILKHYITLRVRLKSLRP